MRISTPAILVLAYFFSELVLAITRRSARAASKDANSLRLLWIVIGVSIWLSIYLSMSWPTAKLTAPFEIIGYAFFLIGIMLPWYSIIHLVWLFPNG